MSIIVVGSVFVDIKGYPSRTYIPGGRNAGKVRYVHGGVSRNIAEDLGNAKCMNVVLFGSMVKALGMTDIDWEAVIEETVPAKFKELNLAAYRAGFDAV